MEIYHANPDEEVKIFETEEIAVVFVVKTTSVGQISLQIRVDSAPPAPEIKELEIEYQ